MAINYEQVGWDTNKYVNPTRMNHMDNGIKAACDKADAHDQQIETINSNFENKFYVINHNVSSFTDGKYVNIPYPNGFNRNNCVCIGVAGVDNTHRSWFCYLNSDNIQVILGADISLTINDNSFISDDAIFRIVLMKI